MIGLAKWGRTNSYPTIDVHRLPNKCIQTINANKQARINEGEAILASVFANDLVEA